MRKLQTRKSAKPVWVKKEDLPENAGMNDKSRSMILAHLGHFNYEIPEQKKKN